MTKKGTAAKRAYEKIRDKILSLELEPGENIDEATFVKALGLSRTPVREALIQLAAEGLVDLLSNHGARVSKVEFTGVRAFFEALDVNQRMVTRWAAVRRTEVDLKRIDELRKAFEVAARNSDVRGMLESNLNLHAAIAIACGNPFVAKHYTQLLSLGLRLSRLSLAYEEPDPNDRHTSHLESIVREHRQIVAALTSGDAEAAEEVVRRHIETFRRRVTEYLEHTLATEIIL